MNNIRDLIAACAQLLQNMKRRLVPVISLPLKSAFHVTVDKSRVRRPCVHAFGTDGRQLRFVCQGPCLKPRRHISRPHAGTAATSIALGGSHTCAIVTGNGIKCWGKNDNGQLGIGNTVQKTSPVDVSLGAGKICGIYLLFNQSTG